MFQLSMSSNYRNYVMAPWFFTHYGAATTCTSASVASSSTGLDGFGAMVNCFATGRCARQRWLPRPRATCLRPGGPAGERRWLGPLLGRRACRSQQLLRRPLSAEPFAVQDKSSTAVQRACRSLGTNYANAPLAQVHACPCTAPCLQQASICKKTRDDFQESELEGRVKSKERDIASFACSGIL